MARFYAHDYGRSVTGTKMKRIFEVTADQGLKPGRPWSRLYGDSMGSAWQNVKGLVRVAWSFGGGSLSLPPPSLTAGYSSKNFTFACVPRTLKKKKKLHNNGRSWNFSRNFLKIENLSATRYEINTCLKIFLLI